MFYRLARLCVVLMQDELALTAARYDIMPHWPRLLDRQNIKLCVVHFWHAGSRVERCS